MFVLIDVIVLWEIDVALCIFFFTFVKIHVSAAWEVGVRIQNSYLFTRAHEVESELDILVNSLNVEIDV